MIKGGSFIPHASYGVNFRISAKIDATSYIGFRTVKGTN